MQQLARDAAEQQACAGRLEAAQQNLRARQSARNEEQETIRQLTQEIDSLRETLAMDMGQVPQGRAGTRAHPERAGADAARIRTITS